MKNSLFVSAVLALSEIRPDAQLSHRIQNEVSRVFEVPPHDPRSPLRKQRARFMDHPSSRKILLVARLMQASDVPSVDAAGAMDHLVSVGSAEQELNVSHFVATGARAHLVSMSSLSVGPTPRTYNKPTPFPPQKDSPRNKYRSIRK